MNNIIKLKFYEQPDERFVAETPVYNYVIYEVKKGWRWKTKWIFGYYLLEEEYGEFCEGGTTYEETKEIAQKHFEERIVKCLK